MATATMDATATMNGGNTSASSDHDNVNIRFGVGGNGHCLAHWDWHGYIGNPWSIVSKFFGADTLPGRVGEASGDVVAQGVVDA